MKKSSFLEGAFIATAAIFFTKFLGIIYVIPFYNIVGTQGGALYGYAYNIYNLFLIISCAGIPLAISKLTSEYNILKKDKEKAYMFSVAKKIILIFSITSFLICFLFAPYIAKIIIGDVTGGNTVTDITYVIRCVSFAILIAPILSISRGYLQGHSFIKPSSFSQVIEQLVRVLVIILGSFFCLKVLNLSLKTAVGVAVFGATIGAISAYLYLIKKLSSFKTKNQDKDKLNSKDKNSIIKKIITYSIPFIIINIASSLYNSTDMILLIRGLNFLNYNGNDIETISSIFTTWGNKLNSIVTSIATGVAIALIPSISESRAKKNFKEINDKLNKILLIFFYIALPIAIFMSLFSREIWTIFYGESFYGPKVFQMLILTAAMDALYIMIGNALQGLNKTKLIYRAVITGLLINLSLDIPLMLLFHNIGIDAYYGAIMATLIGYYVSVIIPIKALKKEFNFTFTDTIKKIPKLFGIYIIMIFLSLIIRAIIFDINNRILLIGVLCVFGLTLVIIYYYLNRKNFKDFLGFDIIDKLRKKRD